MTEENTQNNSIPSSAPATGATAAAQATPQQPAQAQAQAPQQTQRGQGGRDGHYGGSGGQGGQGGVRGGGFKKNTRRSSREGKPRSEFDQKILDIRRVTRVVSGGRRFSFSVALVAGNKKGQVGVGIGKAGDTSLAIDKALKNAKKNMIKVPLNKYSTIPHEVSAKYTSSRVTIAPAIGKGVIAGSSVRQVIELAGIKDVVAKIHSGSKNKLNNAKVAIKALSKFQARRDAPGSAKISAPASTGPSAQ